VKRFVEAFRNEGIQARPNALGCERGFPVQVGGLAQQQIFPISLAEFIRVNLGVAQDLAEKTYTNGAGCVHGNCDAASVGMTIDRMASLLSIKYEAVRFDKAHNLT